MVPSSSLIIKWAGLIRDVGLIIGVPTLIIVGMNFYDRQIEVLKAQVDVAKDQNEALKAQNEFLKQSTFDRTASLLEGQKKTYQIERDMLEKELAELKSSKNKEYEDQIRKLQNRLSKVTEKIGSLDRSKEIIDRANFIFSVFRDDVSFHATTFSNRVDFSKALFQNIVSFKDSIFRTSVFFDGADLRYGSFFQTDLRGVDLSQALIDSKTRLPKVD